MYVKERFVLDQAIIEAINERTPNFGYNGFGEFIFYRTYSRVRKDGKQETWNDVVRRVTEGTFSIRKDWYIRNHIHWDEDFWQHYAMHFALAFFDMQWLPPGRGAWAMGTDFVYERGSMALQNCGFTLIGDKIGDDIDWLMDAMMCGTGCGFSPVRNDDMVIYDPKGSYEYVIPDTREGWCKATRLLINSYLKYGLNKVKLIYDEIRPAGLPIKGFGGISSGPQPLIYYHDKIREFFDMFGSEKWYDSVLLKTDLANAAGCCIVSGNVRRSAEICVGPFDDIVDLKNYEKFPYRETHGWMSNNSVALSEDLDFQRLGEMAERIKRNGEPGYVNLRNLPFARIGKSMEGLRYDKAIGINPCAEQPLEDKELCTLAITCPTRCNSVEQWLKACEYATFYASTVTLLPTHRPETNAVMSRNRRIGVDLTDVVGWQVDIGTTRLIAALRDGYDRVRSTNSWLANEAGIPESVRVTTIKPGGTFPKVPGVRSGWQWPTFGYTLRRVRIAQNSPITKILIEAGVPHEPDIFSMNTEVFEFPIDQSMDGKVKSATEISLWQQAMMLVLLQREWSDNAVSNTLYFKPAWPLVKEIVIGPDVSVPSDQINESVREYLPLFDYEEFLFGSQEYESDTLRIKLMQEKWSPDWKIKIFQFDPNNEEDDIEHVLAAIAPLTKSVSVLPHTSKGVYPQMPEEGITKEEYEKRLASMQKIDWAKLSGSDGQDEKYCDGAICERPQ